MKKTKADILSKKIIALKIEVINRSFFDNCSSRIRDLLIKVYGDQLEFYNSKKQQFTFREIIHEYLKYNPWLELGIDLVLEIKLMF